MSAPAVVVRPIRCGDSGWKGVEGDVSLAGCDDLHDRLTPGPVHGEVPEGECPECGSLVYLDDPASAQARALAGFGGALVEAAVNAAAALETLLAHFGDRMSPADRAGRETTLKELRDALKAVTPSAHCDEGSNADADDEG